MNETIPPDDKNKVILTGHQKDRKESLDSPEEF